MPTDQIPVAIQKDLNEDTRYAIVVKHPLFAKFNKIDLLEFVNLMEEVSYTPNDKIVIENDFVDSIFFISKGKAKITQQQDVDGQSHEVIIGFLDEGETIGLNSTGFFSEYGRRTATVIAMTNMLLLRLDLKVFHQFTKTHNQFFDVKIKDLSNLLIRLNFIKQAYPFSHLNNNILYEINQEIQEINIPKHTLIFSKK